MRLYQRLRRRWQALRRGWRRWRRRARPVWRWLRQAPPPLQVLASVATILVIFVALNIAYHVVRKPTEMFFPVAGALNKMPHETWQQYGPLFRANATATITPELLAALAQVEGAGNPVARTYWRWRFSWNPFQIYQPASSAVGMYQMTDGTFAEARRYCIHDHRVVEDGPWHDFRSCWFNALYMRVVPSHAVELTAVSLDRGVTDILQRRGLAAATPQQAQDLAALIHLCGAGAADGFARRGFRLAPGQRCGDHEAAAYLAQVNAMKRLFARLAAAE
jgi:hypothetical protein